MKVYLCESTPQTVRHACGEVVSTWTEYECPPEYVSIAWERAAQKKSQWRRFARAVNLSDALESGQVIGVGLFSRHKPSDVDWRSPLYYPDYQWNLYASIRTTHQSATIGHVPGAGYLEDGEAFELFRKCAQMSHSKYGYWLEGDDREMGSGLKCRDGEMNQSWWRPEHDSQRCGLLLFDVFPVNFLDNEYLSAPLGASNTSLRDWICADGEKRGYLSLFTDALTEWTVPEAIIAELCEELFRAGRIFYWRFFCPYHGAAKTPEPFYRADISVPWQARGEIPEIFRSDSAGKFVGSDET